MKRNQRKATIFQVGYLTNNIQEINRIRKEAGLPPANYRERFCLNCDKPFMSYGADNRVCRNCNDLTAFQGAVTEMGFIK